MTIKNLAYLALLAGWIYFCYWLYAEGISPRMHRSGDRRAESAGDSIPYPLAFRWASDTALPGAGFEKFKASIDSAAGREEVLVIHGHYFMDEKDSLPLLIDLGHRRVDHAITLLGLTGKPILTEVSPQEITADVKSNPFEAIRFERLAMEDILNMSGDTFELCFPLKDSFALPGICIDSFASWIHVARNRNAKTLHITGTADGSGIAEPMDMAMERALVLKNAAVANGWKAEQIELSTGQRNHPLTLRNRCVVIYFE